MERWRSSSRSSSRSVAAVSRVVSVDIDPLLGASVAKTLFERAACVGKVAMLQRIGRSPEFDELQELVIPVPGAEEPGVGAELLGGGPDPGPGLEILVVPVERHGPARAEQETTSLMSVHGIPPASVAAPRPARPVTAEPLGHSAGCGQVRGRVPGRRTE